MRPSVHRKNVKKKGKNQEKIMNKGRGREKERERIRLVLHSEVSETRFI